MREYVIFKPGKTKQKQTSLLMNRNEGGVGGIRKKHKWLSWVPQKQIHSPGSLMYLIFSSKPKERALSYIPVPPGFGKNML